MAGDVTAIVAATTQNGIGKDGGLPWRLPGEMKYFQKGESYVTVGSGSLTDKTSIPVNVVVMGRKTWESIPPRFRPLAGRRNLVVSRAGVDVGDSAHTSVHSSLPDALSASTSTSSTGHTFLIGGAQLYDQALASAPPLVNRVLLTRILGKDSAEGKGDAEEIPCDAYLTDFTSHKAEDGERIWRLATHRELSDFVGFEVQEGEVKEKGFTYRYEMWVRG